MRVLVTGATGYLGQEVTRTLLRAGHAVVALGLPYSPLHQLQAEGATPLAADLLDTAAWADALTRSDAVVHLAAATGTDPADALRLDNAVVSSVLAHAASAKTFRAFIYTSGTMPFGNTGAELVFEDAPFGVPDTPGFVAWRPGQERRILTAATGGLHGRLAIIRPGFVYDHQGGGLDALLRSFSCKNRHIYLPGTGRQRWPLVALGDLARLYRMVLEAPEGRGIFHAVEERAVAAEAFAGWVARRAGRSAADWRPWPVADARAAIGSLADGLALDQRIGSKRSAELGWVPGRFG